MKQKRKNWDFQQKNIRELIHLVKYFLTFADGLLEKKIITVEQYNEMTCYKKIFLNHSKKELDFDEKSWK